MQVTAKARRSGAWWAVEVAEFPGVFTQARRLDQVSSMVADAIAMFAQLDAGEVEVTVVPLTEVDDLIARAQEARAQADEAAALASALAREAARALAERNITTRDAGALMGVSPQRISQLVAK